MRSSVARAFFVWLFQLLASCSWVASVIIYGSYDAGDVAQLTAALCWTLSNALAAPAAVLPLLGRVDRADRSSWEAQTRRLPLLNRGDRADAIELESANGHST